MGYFESFIGVNPWTAGFTLLNFIALFLVMKRFLLEPIMKLIKDRQQEIDDMYANASAAQANASALEESYQQKLSAALETGEQIVKEATQRGRARQEEILRQANAEASAMRSKAAADIEQEKKKAILDAKSEISGLAIAIAEKVVKRELQDKDQARLVDEFIDELGDGQ